MDRCEIRTILAKMRNEAPKQMAFHRLSCCGNPPVNELRCGRCQLTFNIGESADWWLPGSGRPAPSARRTISDTPFSRDRRLVIDDRGEITVYAHRIFGVAQAQSSDRTLSFTSQDGLVRDADLPKVAG
jgi:hypothetical protein